MSDTALVVVSTELDNQNTPAILFVDDRWATEWRDTTTSLIPTSSACLAGIPGQS